MLASKRPPLIFVIPHNMVDFVWTFFRWLLVVFCSRYFFRKTPVRLSNPHGSLKRRLEMVYGSAHAHTEELMCVRETGRQRYDLF